MKFDIKEHMEPVTSKDVTDAIEEYYFYTAADGLKGAGITPKRLKGDMVLHCTMILKNGFEITTTAIAGCRGSYDRERGEHAAYTKAIGEVYSHLYYQRLQDFTKLQPLVNKLEQTLPEGK